MISDKEQSSDTVLSQARKSSIDKATIYTIYGPFNGLNFRFLKIESFQKV